MEHLLQKLQEEDVHLTLKGDNLELHFNGDSVPAALLQELKARKPEIIAFLRARLTKEETEKLIPALRPAQIPLSFNQERLWFLDQLHGSTNYHLSAVLKLTGEVDMDVLQAVAQQLVERHEVLRTVYQEEEGSVFQAVIPSDDWVFDGVLEASDLDEQGLHQLIERQIKKPFDLASDYMLRMGIVEQEPATRYLILVMHHIASDGWSIPIFVREFANLYAQRLGQKPEQALPSLPVQFIDYALWERQSFREKQWDEKLKYWIEKLEDTPPIDLKTDSPRPLSQSTAGNSVQFRIDVSLMTRLQQLAQEGKTTLYVILLAIFKILLQRYSRQNSICVGTPVANRNLGNTENLIGYFVNTIALKSSVAPEQPFLDFVQELKTTVWNGFEHQEVPFEKIVKEVITERDLSRNPIFQVMFAFQNYKKANQSSQLANLQLETLEHKRRTTKFDLSCNLAEDTQGLDVEFEYSTALFRQESIERMMEHFQTLIQEIVHDPTRSIGSYTMLSTTEAEALKTFSATEVEYPNQVTVIDYFLQHAKNRPGTVALRFEGEQMTYAKLERASRKLAQYLLSKSNEDSKIVGICLERSFEMVVGLLAILRAGLAYVPIDPGYPTKRQAFLLDDTNIQLLLSDQVSAPNLHALETEVIEIDTVLASGNVDESLDLPQLVPTDLAYVIYTSGTTGRPKGVMNAHAGLLNRLLWTQDYFQLQQDVDVVLQKTTFSFDVSVWEFFWPLLAGVPLVISRPGGHQDNAYLAELIRKEKVTTLHFVPSMLQTFLLDWEKGESHPIKRILCSGEALEVQHIQLYQTTLGANIPLYNLYGPTEAAIDVSCWQVPLDSFGNNSVVSIGGPVSNTQLLVLNEQHQQTGIGIIGELFIAGAQLAKGYLNRPELTAERFKELEITGLGRQRLYKTGDLVRWLPNGTIEFIGRNDDQVKIRGNRIELGEIKHALAQVPHITQAEVVVKKDLDGRQLLLAYFTAKSEGLDKADLRERLQDQLPDYMIPHYFVQLESFPLTTNGKLDRKALPDIAAADIIRKTYEAPTNELESLLVQIWEAVLKQEQIGVNDNFFELGGDSIMVIQVVSRLKKHQYSLHPKDLFLAQTIRALAKTVREKKQTVVGEQGRLRGEVPLLPMQLDYLQLNPPTPSHFNQSILLEIDKDVDLASLKQAVAYLFDRHDALRMSFRRKGEQWIQEYGDFQGELISISLEGESAANWSSELELHCARYQSQLEIENGEVARFVFFETPAEVERARLFIVLHHLVTDGISWRVLLNDLESWTNVSDTRDAPPKATSYRQWGEALQHFAQHTIPEMEKRFWLETIAQKSTLPVDQKGSRRPKATIKGITIELERDLTELLLKEIHTAFNTDINDILLSALALALYHWTEQQTTVIGLEGHGREHIAEGIDITDTVGWFTSIFPVPLRVPEGYTLGTLIKATKEQLRKTPRKGLGFGCLKYYSDDPKIREQLRETPWEVTFNYLGSADNALQQTNQKLRPAKESMGAPIADDYPVPNKLEIHALLQAGSLKMYWNFSSEEYQEQTIEQLSQQFVEHLRTIVAYNIQQSDSHKTPSDFGLQDFVNYSELDRFLAQPSATNLQDIYRLSPLQEGLLFHALLDQDSISYREQLLVDFNPELDTKVFQQAWQALTEHHSILRSNIKTSAFDQPVQCVYHSVSLPFEVVDLGEVEDAEQFMDDYLEADRRQGLDLSSAPLFRICLFKHPAYCRMLLSFHHIILDGWSLPLMLKELLKHYDDLSIGKEIQVQQPDNYGDFIKFIQTQHAQSARQFWQQYLEGIEKASLLPFAERLTDQYLGNSIFSTEKLVLDPQRSEDLKAFAKQNHLTINTIIQGAWAFLLAKYTNTQDVLFGVTVAGRPAELDRSQQRLGLYINTIPLRIKVAAGEEVTKWLEQLQLSHAEARGFQYEPLNEIKKHTSLQEAFFDSLIVFENYPISEVVSAQSQLQIQNVQLREETHYLLSIIVVVGEQVEVRFKYNERLDIFYVRQIMAHFEQVIQSWVTNDRALLQNVEYLTPEERDQLLIGNGNLQVTYPQHRTLVQLFLEQAQKTPDHIALTFGEKHLTYQSLDRLSNKLAHHLIQQDHIQPEELVGIYQWHSEWLIITILGILKAGGAYVPIDPDYPQERTDYIKNDSACRIIIGEEWLTEFRANLAEYPETTPQVAVQAENLAYIIYTSGTTGKPKGVQVEHRNVVRLFFNQKTLFDFTDQDVWTMFHSFSFDFSVWEIWGALLFGGRLVVVPKILAQDPFTFIPYLHKEGVTVFNQTPTSFFNLLSLPNLWEANHQLRYVIFGGEALRPQKLAAWKAKYPQVKLINMYGITETTVHVTYKEIGEEEIQNNTSNIGSSIPTLGCYILNDQQQLLPLGAPGEIFVTGAGLSRGYLNREQLTRERFVPNPFLSGQRMYKTGDIGKRLPNGEIQYLGRKDRQVQLRGFRIELPEIEYSLLSIPGIEYAVVTIVTNKLDEPDLVAYFTAEQKQDTNELRASLAQILPRHMVPSYFVQTEVFPQTASGKIDFALLPNPTITTEANTEELLGDAEVKMAEIWERVLNTSGVSPNDNYFNLGGDSIKAIRIASAVNRVFECKIGVAEVFTYPTIRQLLACIEDGESRSIQADFERRTRQELEEKKTEFFTTHPELETQVRALFPASEIQQGMIFHSLANPQVYHDQMVHFMRYPKKVFDKFSGAVQLLVEKHEILRTAFRFIEDELYQLVYETIDPDIHFFDLADKNEEAQLDFIKLRLRQEHDDPFVIETPGLFKFMVFALGEDNYCFCFNCHHAIIDGWSDASLNTELHNLMTRLAEEEHYRPRPLHSSYQDYVMQELFLLQSEEQFTFWQQELKAYRPFKFSLSETNPGRLRLEQIIDPSVVRDLAALSKELRVNIKHLYFSIFLQVLRYFSEHNDLTIGLISNNRLAAEDGDKVLGCFLNTVPFRMTLSPEDEWRKVLQLVDEKMIQLKNYDRYPFGKIIRDIRSRNQVVDRIDNVIFSFTDFHVYADANLKGAAPILSHKNQKKELGGVTNNSAFTFTVDTAATKTKVSIAADEAFIKQEEAELFLTLFVQFATSILMNQAYSTDDLGQFLKSLTPHPNNIGKADQTVGEKSTLEPCSSHQKRLWFIDNFEKDVLYKGGPVYHNVPLFINIPSHIAITDLQHAFSSLAALHEVLRTTFRLEEGQLFQSVIPASDFPADQLLVAQEDLQSNTDRLTNIPFELDEGVLIRAYYEHREKETHFLFLIHHAIVDATSLKLVKRDFLDLLHAPEQVGERTFRSYLSYSNQQLSRSQELDNLSFTYWREKLNDLPVLYFKTDQERVPIHVYEQSTLKQVLTLDDSYTAFAEEHQVDIRQICLAACKMALAKLTGQDDIVIGTMVDLRDEQTKHTVGPIDNLVVLRSAVEQELSLLEIGRAICQTDEEANKHKQIAFERLVDHLKPQIDKSRTALFDVLFAHRFQETEQGYSNVANRGWGKYDFNLCVEETTDLLNLQLAYNKLYFETDTARKLLKLIASLIQRLVETPNVLLKEVPLLRQEEQETILTANAHEIEEVPAKPIPAVLLEQLTKAAPEKAAVVFEEEVVTYQELYQRSNQFASFLIQSFDLQKGDRVAICLPKDISQLTALFGVLLSGAAYVPIDPTWSEKDRQVVRNAAAYKGLIDQEFWEEYSSNVKDNGASSAPDVNIQSSDLAYLIYDLTKAGHPQVFSGTHQSVEAMAACYSHDFNLSSNDSWAYAHSLDFAFSVVEIFTCLLNGGTLNIVPSVVTEDGALLGEFVNEKGITTLFQSSSSFDRFAKSASAVNSLRYLFVGDGEGNPAVAKLWSVQNAQVQLIQLIGTPKSSMCGAYTTIVAGSSKLSGAAKSMALANCYVLDANQMMLPLGRPGELYLAGPVIAETSLDSSTRSNDDYYRNPFRNSGLMLRTGLNVRWLPDGELEFLGYRHEQNKIRGYYVEQREIAQQLWQFRGVEHAFIRFVQSQTGNGILAYLTSSLAVDKTELATFLQSRLPEYLQPELIEVLDQMPLNRHGKVDDTVLPGLEDQERSVTTFVAPESEVEKQIAAIWQKVLKVSPVGVRDNFFDLGGHSLKVVQIINRIKTQLGYDIGIKEVFDNPTVQGIANRLSENQQTPISKQPIADSYPLSAIQRRIWVLSQFAGASKAFNVSINLELRGRLNISALEYSFQAIVARHEILRTHFAVDASGAVRQSVVPAVSFSLNRLTGQQAGIEEDELKEKARSASDFVFALDQAPLLRATLLQPTGERAILVITLHHIICDGWSLEILAGELLEFYNNFASGILLQKEPLAIQYKDYVAWGQSAEQQARLQQQEAFWLAQFATAPVPLNLPSFTTRPAVKTYRGITKSYHFSAPFRRAANVLVQRYQVTLFNVLLAGLNGLFYRYTNQRDITLGVPIAGRNHPDLEQQVGPYLNTLAIRSRFEEGDSFEDLLQILRQELLVAYANQDFSFDALVDQLNPARDSARSPLFDILVVLQNQQNTGLRQQGQFQGLEVKPLADVRRRESQFDMTFSFMQREEEIRLDLEYNSDIYDPLLIEQLVAHFENFIEFVAQEPASKLTQVPFLTELDRSMATPTIDRPDSATHFGETITSLFAAQVRQSLDETAVVVGGKRLTFQDLDHLSSQLAHFLLAKYEIGVEDVIAVKMERNEWLVISFLAILKAGGAYLPLDPNLPEQRLLFMTKDSHCVGLVDDLLVQEFIEQQEQYALHSPAVETTEGQLAYVIYTSGTTGQPKGVAIEHRGIVNTIVTQIEKFGVSPVDNCLQFANQSFDASIWEMLISLLGGATLCIIEEQSKYSIRHFLNFIQDNEISWATLPPVFVEILPVPELKGLKTLITAGDRAPLAQAKAFARAGKYYNAYGPTETSICATVFHGDMVDKVPIGTAIKHAEAYVLSDHLELQPIGVPGELYVGGPGLARGYLNQVEQTATSFIPHPFAAGQRLYRTGDLVRWLPDGNLEFLGRIDDQIKLRGYRIEPKEVEQALVGEPNIQQAVVLVRQRGKDKLLVAYLVAEEVLDTSIVKANMSNVLPAYMIPDVLSQIPAIPVTPNGKVDKAQLPDIAERVVAPGARIPSSNVLELELAQIVADCLSIAEEEIGIHDNFFDLGANSIQLIRILNLVNEKFNLDLSAVTLFQYSNIYEAVQHITASTDQDLIATLDPASSSTIQLPQGDIAVIGMAGQFPKSEDLQAFWKNLLEGNELIRHYTEQELKELGVDLERINNPAFVKAQSIVDSAEQFDYHFFGYTKDEAMLMDPQTRMLHQQVWTCIEDAGYTLAKLPQAVGLFLAASDNLNWRIHAATNTSDEVTPFRVSQISDRNFAGTLVSYALDLKGPSYLINTACSSSLVSVHMACQSILSGESSVALAGGVKIDSNANMGYFYQQDMIFSPDGSCRPFDANSAGTISGEGAGVVLLKPLEKAIQDRDNIYAVIRSSATNNDGNRKVGFSAPSYQGQVECLEKAYRQAQIPTSSISYIEAHGTGTKLGDAIEIEALNQVFQHDTDHQCAIGSVKSNVGHLDTAAGIAGFMKAALAVKTAWLPQTLHFQTSNPNLNFANGPFSVDKELRKWELPAATPRRAGVSSFGIGGTNAHVVLEEPPEVPFSESKRRYQFLTYSAKSGKAVTAFEHKLATFFAQIAAEQIADAVYTLNSGRTSFGKRNFLVFRGQDEVQDQLLLGKSAIAPTIKKGTRLAFLLQGQGGQHYQMAHDLYGHEPVFRDYVDQGLAYLKEKTGKDYAPIIGYTLKDAPSVDLIHQTGNAHVLLFIVEYAVARLLMSWGLQPDLLVGHSLGEYVAACLSGVFSFEDGLLMLLSRAELVKKVEPGKMIMIECPLDEVEDLLTDKISVALINTENTAVLSGRPKDIDDFANQLEERQITFRALKVEHAFHSYMMDHLVEEYLDAISGVTFSQPTIPMISGVTGEEVTPELMTNPGYWARHLNSTIHYATALKTTFEKGSFVFIEIGPGKILTNFLREHSLFVPTEHLVFSSLQSHQKEEDDDAFLLKTVGRLWSLGLNVDWEGFYQAEELRKITAPTYCFDKYQLPARVDLQAKLKAGGWATGTPAISDRYENWIYEPQWKQARPVPTDTQAAWTIVLAGQDEFSKELVSLLDEDNTWIIYLHWDELQHPSGKQVLVADPINIAELRQVFAFLGEDLMQEKGRLICSWTVGMEQKVAPAHLLQEAQNRGYYTILNCMRLLAEKGAVQLDIVFISNGIFSILGTEHLQPEKATALGALKVIPKEYDEVNTLCIDFALTDLQNDLSLVQRVYEQISCVGVEEVIGVRGRRTWVPSFARIPAVPKEEELALQRGGVYLITGASGGMGQAFSEYLSSVYDAHLILVGRSSPSSGLPHSSAVFVQNNLADSVSLSEEIAKALQQLGQTSIDGVIHAAGVADYAGFIKDRIVEDCEEIFLPKVSGTVNLFKSTVDYWPSFFVNCSSLATIVAPYGQVGYVAANLFQNHFAQAQTGTTKMVSILWDVWKEQGMAIKNIERFNTESAKTHIKVGMTNEQGLQILVEALQQDVPQLVVSIRSLEAMIAFARENTIDKAVEQVEEESVLLLDLNRLDLSTPYEEPQTEVEEKIQDIWQAFFGYQQVGVNDSFFELGGDSLKAISILKKINAAFDLEIGLKELFDKSTIRLLATEIELALSINDISPTDKEENNTNQIRL